MTNPPSEPTAETIAQACPEPAEVDDDPLMHITMHVKLPGREAKTYSVHASEEDLTTEAKQSVVFGMLGAVYEAARNYSMDIYPRFR
jgi:hypothetical protein